MYLPWGLWVLDPHSYINISLKLTYEHVKNTQKNRPTPTVLFFTNTSLVWSRRQGVTHSLKLALREAKHQHAPTEHQET